MLARSLGLVMVVVCALFLGACGTLPGTVSSSYWGTSDGEERGPLTLLTDPGELPELRLAGKDETDEASRFPLDHTHVKAKLTGFVGEVEITQTFQNPHKTPIEAVYIFPLPENSAVHHMEMRIGERVVVAEIKERNEARQTYETAKSEGFAAALLEQERPNVFTQSVANIAPGKRISVVVRYVQDLSYDAGEYEFVFPMVVGPRFIPGETVARPAIGSGTHADTDRVPDASRITPPYLGKGERSGHDISLELAVDAGLPVEDVRVPTHDVEWLEKKRGMKLTLAKRDKLPNRDFVMRYRVAGDEPRAALITSSDSGSGYFALVVQPPELPVERLVGRREIIFVVDVSGSMYGEALSLCKEAMRNALTRLRPRDTFNVITFSGSTGKLFPSPAPANRSSIAAALAHVEAMSAGGGTMMLDAVKEALHSQVGEGRHRYVFFLTDGEVGNEAEIIGGSEELVARLEKRGQRARVFGFGVGSAPNRFLLDGLSKAGKGLTVYASGREDPAVAVDRFYRYIDSAVVRDLAIAGDVLDGAEMYPRHVPELFASHPVIIHGRYREPPKGSLRLTGYADGRSVTIPVAIHRAKGLSDDGRVLGALWARAKVEQLERNLWQGDGEAQRAITTLGLSHRLVTPFTSFVAVDRSARVSNGRPTTIVQPVEVPEGVDAEHAGARESNQALPASPPAGEVSALPSRAAGGEQRRSHAIAPAQPTPILAPPVPPPAAAAPPPAVAAPPAADEPAEPSPSGGGEVDDEPSEKEAMRATPKPSLPEASPNDRGCYCATPVAPRSSLHAWLVGGLVALALGRRWRRASVRTNAG
jgi:Ca-activated chloride channel family protein